MLPYRDNTIVSIILEYILDEVRIVSLCKFVQMELGLGQSLCKCRMMTPLRWSPVWCLPPRLRCQSQYMEVFRE